MGAAWDEVDLLDMVFEAARDVYTYPCPCGDLFMMPVDDLLCAEELAPCPSCSLLQDEREQAAYC
jgi:diphthamide biosynthesis protein 3